MVSGLRIEALHQFLAGSEFEVCGFDRRVSGELSARSFAALGAVASRYDAKGRARYTTPPQRQLPRRASRDAVLVFAIR
jgi:hypothetical protein